MSYKYFLAALKKEVDENWQRQRATLATEADISKGFLSSVISEKRQAGYNAQVNIAEACGYTYFDFLNYGRSLVEGDLPPPELEPRKAVCDVCESKQKYRSPKVLKILKMAEQLDEAGDDEALDALFKYAESGVKREIGASIEERVKLLEEQMGLLLTKDEIKKTG